MKVAITGSNGFIGCQCINTLKKYTEVIALYRAEDGELHNEVKSVTNVCTDYSYNDLLNKLKECDAVVHLAAQKVTRENEEYGLPGYLPSLELNGTVLRVCREIGINNIVVMSSRCVYGTNTEDMFRESDELHPINFYGVSKTAIENECMYYNEHFKMNIKVLRLGQVVGMHMSKAMFSVFLEQAMNNEVLTLIGSDIRDYIYIKDVCTAILCSLKAENASGIYNISSGLPYDNKTMAEEIISAVGSKSQIIRKETANDYNPSRIVLDCKKAKDDLGFECSFDSFRLIVQDMKTVPAEKDS